MSAMLGLITYWGFSPSIDLLEGDRDWSGDSCVNILLVGAGDLRHVLHTASCLFRHNSGIKLNFYIIENNLELYARDLILYYLSSEQLSNIGLQDKTEMFLEIYGNTLIRQKTNEYLQNVIKEAIRMVTDLDYLTGKLPGFDLSALKYKERDFIECVLKMWMENNKNPFDATAMWDIRLRHHLKSRYDAIPHVFDWDCSMVLQDRGAKILHSREYSHWRHKGVAYELREAAYDVSNRTLMCPSRLRTPQGDSSVRLGYWGDIVCSPYLTWGIQSENQSFFQKSNNTYTHGASNVAEYNVLAMFHRLAHQTEYVKQEDHKATTSSTATITEIPEEDEEQEENKTIRDENSCNQFSNGLGNVQIHFLPIDSLQDLTNKNKFQHFFNKLFIACSMSHVLDKVQNLSTILNDNCQVILESAIFLTEVNKTQLVAFTDRLKEMANSNNFKIAQENFDPMKDPLLKFSFHRTD